MPSKATLGGFPEVHHFGDVWEIKSGLKRSQLFQRILNNCHIFFESLNVF